MIQRGGQQGPGLAVGAATVDEPVTRDLEVMAAAEHYYEWILEEIGPFLGRRILECGSGTGTLTGRLLALGADAILASDVDEAHLAGLRERCRWHPSADTIRLDLEDPGPALDAIRSARIDSIVMVNVLEHIADDGACLRSLADALPRGGRIILFCPAFQALFSELDREYGHYRRYSKTAMMALGRRVGLPIVAMHYVNVPGFFAWLLLHRMLRWRGLDRGSVSIFNRLAPLARRCESLFRPPVGLSIVTVFDKG